MKNLKTNLISEMGPIFLEWAEMYFENRKNIMIEKKIAHKSFKSSHKVMESMSIMLFKKRVKQYCAYKGYFFGSFIKESKGLMNEYFFIQSHVNNI